jgi:hypothetical protein
MTESPIRTSAETDKIDAAMASAQAELENPIKGQTANLEGKSKATGREYKIGYTYTDIAGILADCRPILAKHGVATYQIPVIAPGSVMIIVTRLACSGQWIEGDYPVCHIGGDHQEMGAAMTYARRYALGAMIGIAPEKDTDYGVGAAAPKGPSNREPLAAHNRAEDRAQREPLRQDTRGGEREPPKSSAQAKKDGDWERYTDEMKAMRTLAELTAWAKANAKGIKALPKKWFDELQALYEDRKNELGALEDGNGQMDREYADSVR